MIGWNRKNDAPPIYILPTKEGIAAFLILGLMTLISLNYNNNLAFLLTFMLLSMLILSTMFTHKTIAALKFHSFSANPVFCGEDAVFRCSISSDNDSTRQCTLRLRGGEPRMVDLKAGADTVELSVKTAARGELKVDRLDVSTTFPFGLFVAWREIKIEARSLVYPRPIRKQLEIVESEGDGKVENKTVPAPGCDDYEGVREYTPGDPVKRIDWRAYSRTGELLTKMFSRDSGKVVTLDFSSVRAFDLEERLSILGYWVLNYSRKGVPFALKIPGVTYAPGTGEKHLHECLKMLALFPRSA